MDNGRRTSGTSFADEFDEFDHLLDDDDTSAPAAGATRSQRAVGDGPALKPARRRLRRPSMPRTSGDRPSIRITPDWNRVAAVLFVGIVVLALLYFLVTSIAHSRRDGAYRDYAGSVRSLASQSEAQGDQLESILVEPNGGTIAERVAKIETLGARVDKLAADAKALDVPEQMQPAQAWLETSLEYRSAGIAALQRSLSASASAKDQSSAATSVANAMARLVASDVVWSDSFATSARDVLKADGVDGISFTDSVFFGDLDEVAPSAVEKMLDRLQQSGPATAGDADLATCPTGKTCGGQLESGRVTVTPSGQTLTVGALTEIKGGDNIVFEVPFTNQGEVQLTQVPVKVTLRGDDSDPVTLTGVIDVVDPGQTATAKVALDDIPNFGEVLDMDVLVGPIAGEKTADNNGASYQIQFSI